MPDPGKPDLIPPLNIPPMGRPPKPAPRIGRPISHGVAVVIAIAAISTRITRERFILATLKTRELVTVHFI